MYSLYESCKLNDLNFFDYINDVLTRLMKGEMDYKSLIPCNYKPLPKIEEEQEEVAWSSKSGKLETQVIFWKKNIRVTCWKSGLRQSDRLRNWAFSAISNTKIRILGQIRKSVKISYPFRVKKC